MSDQGFSILLCDEMYIIVLCIMYYKCIYFIVIKFIINIVLRCSGTATGFKTPMSIYTELNSRAPKRPIKYTLPEGKIPPKTSYLQTPI